MQVRDVVLRLSKRMVLDRVGLLSTAPVACFSSSALGRDEHCLVALLQDADEQAFGSPMDNLRGSSAAASHQHSHATVSERKQSSPVRLATCKLPCRAAVLVAIEPCDEVCCMIGCVGYEWGSGVGQYLVSELGCIIEASI